MYLHKIRLNQRCREARRDLADPYQLHSTLCRAFCMPDQKCPEGEILWRLECGNSPTEWPCVLVQSRSKPNWARLGREWLAEAAWPPIDLKSRLRLDALESGRRFRFRLRANPCVTRNRKRLGLLRLGDQEKWIERKGGQHGFALPKLRTSGRAEDSQERIDVRVSQEQMLQGNQQCGNGIRIFSVLYDGVLTVADPSEFGDAIQAGIGHGKVLGLGLLSVAPMT